MTVEPGKQRAQGGQPTRGQQVTLQLLQRVHTPKPGHSPSQGDDTILNDTILNLLHSDSSDSDSEVRSVRIKDSSSKLRCFRVQIHGVPVLGLIDTGVDITIMGQEVFKKVASVVCLFEEKEP